MNIRNSIYLAAMIAGVGAAGWWVLVSGNDGQRSVGESDTSTAAEGTAIVQVELPDELSPQAQIGQRGYEAICAVCHGENAAGRDGIGPPLVHRIYEPSHHADMAFVLAAQNGVRAHHWDFGNMPPVDGLTRADVLAIAAYVRELQRANGIN